MDTDQLVALLQTPKGMAAGGGIAVLLCVAIYMNGCQGDNKDNLRRFALSNAAAESEPPPAPAETPSPEGETPGAEQPAGEQPAAATPEAPIEQPPQVAAASPEATAPAVGQPVNPSAVAPPGSVPPSGTPTAPQAAGENAIAYSQDQPQLIITVTRPEFPLEVERARAQSIDNLQRIAAALEAYSQSTRTYPPLASRDAEGRPLLSWRVHLLPQLGYANLYRQFRLTEPWDSAYNRQLIAQIPPVYMSPERFDEKTNYLAVAGRDRAFFGTIPRSPEEFEDPRDATLVVLEVDDAASVPWTQPIDYAPPSSAPRTSAGHLRADGLFAILATHQVTRVPSTASDFDLAAMFSIDGGEQLPIQDLLATATSAIDSQTVAKASIPEPTLPGVGGVKPMNSAGSSGSLATGPLPQATLDAIDHALHKEKLTPANDIRLPVPDERLLTTAREQLRELYGKEYEAAKRPEDKQNLLKKLVDDSIRLADDPPAYYEALRICLSMSCALGETETALRILELLELKFQFDGLTWRANSLEALAKTVRTQQQIDTLYGEAQRLLILLLNDDNYAAALKSQETLLAIARRRGNRAETNFISQQLKTQIEQTQEAYVEVPAALEKLQANPTDPIACETAGTYFCLLKNRWEVGLPLLVRGENVKLRVVAAIDLEPEKSPKTLVQLGDQYFEMASSSPAVQRLGFHMRAVYYYRQAVPLMTGNLDKLRIEKRLTEIANHYGASTVDRMTAAMNPAPLAADPVAVDQNLD